MSINSQKSPIDYWKEIRLEDGSSCHNVSFFRLLGYSNISLKDKSVLEIGFGANRGKDLLECQNRGAKIWGVDINESYIHDFQQSNPKIPVALMNAGIDEIPFNHQFDLIFHRDVIYYLTNEQIKFHLNRAFENLNNNGHLVFQFIENDLAIDKATKGIGSKKINFDDLKYADTRNMFRGETNPLRTLDIDWLIASATDAGFKLQATKTHIESYTQDESVFRIDRYLVLLKE
jgi:2-polyprenyl-3-methyl-5-hydroxy-6-metoxy-1,4-benzoquinol methylase